MNSFVCLTEEQVLWNLNNVVSIMKLPKMEKKFDGQIKDKGVKSADKYQLFECKNEFYFLVVYARKFNIKYFEACKHFESSFDNFVKKSDRPKVYLCSAFVIKKKDYKALTQELLSVPFRFVRLTKIHPLTGSPTPLHAHVRSYERLETKEKAPNGNDFPIILDSDPAVILVNALPGELIRYKEVIIDNGKPYTQYKIRRVLNTRSSIMSLDASGVANVE